MVTFLKWNLGYMNFKNLKFVKLNLGFLNFNKIIYSNSVYEKLNFVHINAEQLNF